MANVNKVILIGNLTRDPETRVTGNGTAVADLGLAINRKFKSGDETKEETTFVDVTLWARLAEIAGEYLKKGNAVYIEGRLQLDSWEDKQSGEKRSKLLVVAENLQLLTPKGEGGTGGGKSAPAPKSNAKSSGRAPARQAPAQSAPDDDIPF